MTQSKHLLYTSGITISGHKCRLAHITARKHAIFPYRRRRFGFARQIVSHLTSAGARASKPYTRTASARVETSERPRCSAVSQTQSWANSRRRPFPKKTDFRSFIDGQAKGRDRTLLGVRPRPPSFIKRTLFSYALGSALAASRPAMRPKIMHSALDEAPW